MKARLLLLLLYLLLLCSCAESAGEPVTTDPQTEAQSAQTQVSDSLSDTKTDLSSEESVCSHVFGEWTTKPAAEEGVEGEEERVCTLCGETEVRKAQNLPVHVHSYTETVYLPDCTEDGFTQKVCPCGDTVTDHIVKAPGHRFGEWITISAPTTQQEGVKSHTCEVCGTTEKESVEKLKLPPVFHVHVYTETVYEPTCTENGYILSSCSCGDYYTRESGQKSGHSFGEWRRVLAPDVYCGLDRRDCIACGEVGMRTVPVYTEVPWPTPPTGDDDVTTDEEEGNASLSDGSASETSGENGSEESDEGTPPDRPVSPTITYYSQRDSRWGNVEMGCGIMKNNGCGPSAIAIAMSYYGINVTPLDVAEWLYENTIEFNHAFHGISGTGLRLGLEHYGREVVPIENYAQLYQHLKLGAVVVGCHGQGYFVSKKENSHCITMVGLDENGKTYCYDPYTSSKNGFYDVACLWAERSELEVDLRQEGITHYAVY